MAPMITNPCLSLHCEPTGKATNVRLKDTGMAPMIANPCLSLHCEPTGKQQM